MQWRQQAAVSRHTAKCSDRPVLPSGCLLLFLPATQWLPWLATFDLTTPSSNREDYSSGPLCGCGQQQRHSVLEPSNIFQMSLFQHKTVIFLLPLARRT